MIINKKDGYLNKKIHILFNFAAGSEKKSIDRYSAQFVVINPSISLVKNSPFSFMQKYVPHNLNCFVTNEH